MEIADRMKFVRKTLGLSQQEFGKRLGVSRDVVNNIENYRVAPTELVIKSVCHEFNVDYLWLTEEEGEMFRARSDELYELIRPLLAGQSDFARRVFRAFTELSTEEWQLLEGLIDRLSGHNVKQSTDHTGELS